MPHRLLEHVPAAVILLTRMTTVFSLSSSCAGAGNFAYSPGLLDNNTEQIRNKLKFQHMFLKQHRKTYQKSSKIRLVLVPEIGVLKGKWG